LTGPSEPRILWWSDGQRRCHVSRHGETQLPKLTFPDEIQEKLERAVALRWIVDRNDPHRFDEIEDEKSAVRAKLTKLFGPVIRQLVEAEILYVFIGENDASTDPYTPIAGVDVDDKFGITLDCEPRAIASSGS
jgi:hypothetical protein